MKANTHLEQNNNINSNKVVVVESGVGQNVPSAALIGQKQPAATAGAVH